MNKLRGQVWVFDDNVDTDQILPGYAMAEDFSGLAKYAMAGSKEADFAKRVKQGDIIVAGKNFGCGSSREQAPVALQAAGVSLIIAPSFARIFRRNAINIGLPVLVADLGKYVQTGDWIEADLVQGIISTPDREVAAQALSANVLATINAGGLINRVRQELGVNND
ncbi:3-isopropylmalate dehydratase [Sporomusa sp.]|uniref:LeuD/DmdB family oxidoreductase small subunit n=1 Tax=Sporomusa sp. TaxID=2078658 RepID=UPI002BB1E9B7|nr:3-isopropylmalate dehydratase [Sporomusa sp.]HWR41948.1 3-isopropylmalate dehydratase [Sporomusa sp.]